MFRPAQIRRDTSSLPIFSVAMALVVIQLLCACLGHSDTASGHGLAEHASPMADATHVVHEHTARADGCEHCDGESVLHAQAASASPALLLSSTSVDFVDTAVASSEFPTPAFISKYRSPPLTRPSVQETLISQSVRLQV